MLAGYIDDIINVGDDFSDCIKNVVETVYLLDKLGFIVHPDKSQFYPSQVMEFLGFIIDSRSMTIRLTDEKKDNLFEIFSRILDDPHCTISN